MAKTKAPHTTAKSTTKKISTSEKIENAYKRHLLMTGHDPTSVFMFADELGIKEAEFYNHYSSFLGVKQSIWNGFITTTLNVLEKDEGYAQYSSREKLLAFYYTLLEVLKGERSFVSMSFKDVSKAELRPDFLKSFKESFETYSKQLIQLGTENNEIQDRPIIGKKYDEALWLQLLFVINFWLSDTSKQFEKTDAAVEKAVSLSFDLMGPGPLDSMIDFAKFLYHNR